MTEVGKKGRDKGMRPDGAHSHDISGTEQFPN